MSLGAIQIISVIQGGEGGGGVVTKTYIWKHNCKIFFEVKSFV
jgi:hypothetical protein